MSGAVQRGRGGGYRARGYGTGPGYRGPNMQPPLRQVQMDGLNGGPDGRYPMGPSNSQVGHGTGVMREI